MSHEEPQVIKTEFRPYERMTFRNVMDGPKRFTVRFSSGESVATVVLKGGELVIQCADTPAQVDIHDIDDTEMED